MLLMESEKEENPGRPFTDKALDALDEVFFVFTATGKMVQWNRRVNEVTGYTDEEIARMRTVDFFSDEDASLIRRRIRDVVKRGRVRVKAHLQTKAGQNIPYEFTGSLLEWEGERLICGTGRDVSDKRRMERDILHIQEEERRRIGQELHDGIVSQLMGILMISGRLAGDRERGKDVPPEELREVTEMIRDTARQARRLSHGLNPIELEGGLPDALEQLASTVEKQSGIACAACVGEELPDLEEKVATHLYRIAQEAINNAVKHAAAETIEVCLTSIAEGLELTVTDDGKGIPELEDASEGLGLRTMRYRADLIGGWLEVTNWPEGGTQVCCRVDM